MKLNFHLSATSLSSYLYLISQSMFERFSEQKNCENSIYLVFLIRFTFGIVYFNPLPTSPTFSLVEEKQMNMFLWLSLIQKNYIRCTSYKLEKPRHFWNKLIEGLLLKTNWTGDDKTCLFHWIWLLGIYHADLLSRQDRMREYSPLDRRQFFPQFIKLKLQNRGWKAAFGWFRASHILLLTRNFKLHNFLSYKQYEQKKKKKKVTNNFHYSITSQQKMPKLRPEQQY